MYYKKSRRKKITLLMKILLKTKTTSKAQVKTKNRSDI